MTGAAPEPASRRVAVVMNGKAGALLDQPGGRETIEAAFGLAGFLAEFVEQEAGTLPERVRLAAKTGASAVIVAGGDGTVACAAQELAGTKLPLGVLPFGTMNMLANDLGLPAGDLPAAVRILADGAPRAIDVGQIGAEVGGHAFLCASMLGVPAKMGRVREQTRGGAGALARMARMARALLRFGARMPPLRLRLRIDGRLIRVRAASLTIVVNALDAAAGAEFKRARLDGGEFAIYIVPAVTPGSLALLTWRKLRGRWRGSSSIEEHRGREVVVESRVAALHVMNDGELRLLEPPLIYRVRPRALQVIAPLIPRSP